MILALSHGLELFYCNHLVHILFLLAFRLFVLANLAISVVFAKFFPKSLRIKLSSCNKKPVSSALALVIPAN